MGSKDSNIKKAITNIFGQKRAVITLAALVLGAISIIPSMSHAAPTAQLYISPSSQAVTTGSNLVFSVVINTGGSSVNTVQTVVNYPSANYSLVGIAPGSSFSSFPNSTSPGTIQFSAATTGSVSGTQTVATVTLRANSTGNTSVSLANVCGAGDFSTNCSAAYDSATSENDLGSKADAAFSVSAPVTQNPGTPPSGGSSGGTGSASSKPSSTGGSAKPSTSAPGAAATATGSASASANPGPTISNLSITDIKDTSAVVSWQTDVPATSQVLFGLTDSLGLVAKSDGLVTNHQVVLGPEDLAKGNKYNLKVVSAAANGQSTSSELTQFSTLGFTVKINVVNSSNKAAAGAVVTLAGVTKTADKNGVVTFDNILAGDQKVAIKGSSKTYTITVGSYLPGTKTYQPQVFTLRTGTPILRWIIIGAVVIVAVVVMLYLAYTGGPKLPSLGGRKHFGPNTMIDGRQPTIMSSSTMYTPPANQVTEINS